MSGKTERERYEERLTVTPGSFRILRPGRGEMNLRDTGLPGAQSPTPPIKDGKKGG